MRVSRSEITASREASRMSHAAARSSPPPMHGPWIAQIVGTLRCRSFSIARCSPRMSVRSLWRGPAVADPRSISPHSENALGRSSPYENAFASAPRITSPFTV